MEGQEGGEAAKANEEVHSPRWAGHGHMGGNHITPDSESGPILAFFFLFPQISWSSHYPGEFCVQMVHKVDADEKKKSLFFGWIHNGRTKPLLTRATA